LSPLLSLAKRSKIILILLVIFSFSISCNKDNEVDCQERKNEINEYYTQQIILADGNSQKIELLMAERDMQLRKVCD